MGFIIVVSVLIFVFGTWYRYHFRVVGDGFFRVFYIGLAPKSIEELLGAITQLLACFLVISGSILTKVISGIRQGFLKDILEMTTFPLSLLISGLISAGIFYWVLIPRLPKK